MAVYTRKIQPSLPIAADPMVVSSYYIANASGSAVTIPVPGRGRLVHVEGITDVVVANGSMIMTVTNPSGTTLGAFTVGSSGSAQGDKDTWTDAETGVASDYIIDNDYITITMTADASTTGALMLHCVLESAVNQ